MKQNHWSVNVDMSTLQQVRLQGLVLIVLECSADSSILPLVPTKASRFTLLMCNHHAFSHSAAQYDTQYARYLYIFCKFAAIMYF